MTSTDIPASFGVHGPGETTTRSYGWPSSSSTGAASLRIVTGLGAELAEVLHEVVGERVVVVDDQDPHGQSSWPAASSIARTTPRAFARDSSYS